MNMRAWWRGTPEQRYAVGVYCIYWVMLVILPLLHLPAFGENIGLIYLTKVFFFWASSLVMLLWFCLQRRDFRRTAIRGMLADRPMLWATAALLITAGLSFAGAPDWRVAAFGVSPNYSGLISYLAMVLFIALSIPALRLIARRRLLDPAYVAFSLLALVIMAQFLVHDFLFDQGSGAMLGVMAGFGNRNYAGMPYLWLFLLALAESLLPTTTPRRRRALLIPLALSYSVVLASLTRAVWVSLTLTLLIMALFAVRRQPTLIRCQRRHLTIVALLLVLLPPLVNGLGRGALVSRVDATTVALDGGFAAIEDASSGRWGIWRAGIALLGGPRALLTGIGPNSFFDVAENSPLVRRLDWVPKNTSLHNQYLESLVTLGVPGLCAFLAVAAILWRRACRLVHRDLAYLGPWLCLISMAVNLLFISVNFPACLYFFPLVAVIVADDRAAPSPPVQIAIEC